jgi:aarF domain-containing kinase
MRRYYASTGKNSAKNASPSGNKPSTCLTTWTSVEAQMVQSPLWRPLDRGYSTSFSATAAALTVRGDENGADAVAFFLSLLFGNPSASDFDSWWRTRRRMLDPPPTSEDEFTTSATILACSGALVGSLEEDDNNRNIVARRWKGMCRWLRRLCEGGWNVLLMTVRGTEIAAVLSPLLLLVPASVLSDRLLHMRAISDLSWSYTVRSMQYLGPAFVKLCQWIATRRDLFPPAACDRLSKLHDRGLPHPWRYTRMQLATAFGDDYEAKGLVVHPDVIGCGSAAQVHRGTLTTVVSGAAGRAEESSPGMVHRPVAVKVLHPKFASMVHRDLRFLQTLSDVLHSLPMDAIRMLNLPRAVRTFGVVLWRQADLRIEGDNLRQFRENFYASEDEERSSSIVFPCPMEGWVAPNVLVEELVQDAVPIAEYLRDSSEAGQQIRKELASPLLRAFLKMVFIDNFIHSDLHPGNVLIRTSVVGDDEEPSTGVVDILGKGLLRSLLDSKSVLMDRLLSRDTATESEPSQPRVRRTIVFLDAGIATTLSPEDQRNLHDLFRAVILNDGAWAGRIMVERAKYERCSQIPGGIDAFSAGIRDLVSEFHDCRKQGLTLGAVRIGSLLSRVLDLCRVHGVEIDPSMASVVISTLVLEGLGRSLAPSLNLIDFAGPFVLGRGRV